MNSFFENISKNVETQRRLIADTLYMDWLSKFTETYPKFTDDRWLYTKDGISVQDYENVENLTHFFDAIEKFCDANLVKVNGDSRERWYNIKYKELYLAIGVCIGQGAFCFVSRYENKEEILAETFVDFEDVLKNKKISGYKQREELLIELEKLIKKIKDSDIPKYKVEAIINNCF